MKIRNLFMLLAMVAFVLPGCNKDDDGKGSGDDEEINFYLKMDLNEAKTKAETQKAPEVKAEFANGALFFTDGIASTSNIVRYVRITEQFATGTVTPQQLENGYLFAGIDASATHVVIIGNVDFSDPAHSQGYATIGQLETAITIDIVDQTDTNFGITKATLFGQSRLSSQITLPGAIAADANREAEVDLRPLIARFEIEKVTGVNSGTPVDGDIDDGFELQAIYIDDFYYTSTVTGTYSYFQNISYEDGVTWEYYSRHKTGPFTTGTTPVYNHDGYTEAWHKYLFDDGGDDNSGGINGLGVAGVSPNAVRTITPSTIDSEVWAYNLYADAGNVPHIILHLTGVKVYDETANSGAGDYVLYNNTKTGTPGEAYLTVTGFRSISSGTSITPEGGYIYRIKDLAFKGSNLREEPEGPDPEDPDPEDKLDVWVEVVLMEWEVVEVDPIFN